MLSKRHNVTSVTHTFLFAHVIPSWNDHSVKSTLWLSVAGKHYLCVKTIRNNRRMNCRTEQLTITTFVIKQRTQVYRWNSKNSCLNQAQLILLLSITVYYHIFIQCLHPRKREHASEWPNICVCESCPPVHVDRFHKLSIHT